MPVYPVFYYIAAFIIAALLTYVATWVDLIGWRGASSWHWTEQARRLYPARIAALYNLVLIPALLVLLLQSQEPLSSWKIAAVVSYLGCLAGLYPMEQALYPQLSVKQWLHQAAATLVFRSIRWLSLAAAAVLMPTHVGRQMGIVTAAYLILHITLRFGGGYTLMRLLGIMRPANPRLLGIVHDVSARMHNKVRRIWELTSLQANAFAVTTHSDLIFTSALLETTPDQELKAITAHELAHLTESNWVFLVRIIGSFLLGSLIFIKPVYATWNSGGLIVLGAGLWIAWMAVLGSPAQWNREPTRSRPILNLMMRFMRGG